MSLEFAGDIMATAQEERAGQIYRFARRQTRSPRYIRCAEISLNPFERWNCARLKRAQELIQIAFAYREGGE